MSNEMKMKGKRPSRHRPPSWRILIIVLVVGMALSAVVAGFVAMQVEQQLNPVTARGGGSISQGETTIFGSLTVEGDTTFEGAIGGNADGYIWLKDQLVITGTGEITPQLTIQGGSITQTAPVLQVKGIDGKSNFELDARGNISTTGQIKFDDSALYATGSTMDAKLIGSTTPLVVTGTYLLQNYHNPYNYEYTGFYSGACTLLNPPTASAASCAMWGGMWPQDQGFQIEITVYDSAGITATVPVTVSWHALVQP